jgi:ferrochelatase
MDAQTLSHPPARVVHHPNAKVGVLLFNLGGPDSLANVKPFLYNLFNDGDMVQLGIPPLLQRLFAWRISNKREHEAQENYERIGGRSPLEPLSREQGEHLGDWLAQQGKRVNIYMAMRCWHPMTAEAVKAMKADGIERLILLPLYPHYSLATTGSSWRELKRHWPTLEQDVELATVCAYYDDPTYLAALADTVATTLQRFAPDVRDQVHVVFSAHGLPQNYVKKNKDPYPQHCMATATALMQTYFPQLSWQMAYQSKVGPLQWLTPYTEDLLPELGKTGTRYLMLVPLSFVSEHIETLYEMDMLYQPLALEHGVVQCERVPALNSHPTFIQALGQLVLRAMHQESTCRIQWPHLAHPSAAVPGFVCGSATPEAVTHAVG